MHTANGLVYSAKLSHRLQSGRLNSFPWNKTQYSSSPEKGNLKNRKAGINYVKGQRSGR